MTQLCKENIRKGQPFCLHNKMIVILIGDIESFARVFLDVEEARSFQCFASYDCSVGVTYHSGTFSIKANHKIEAS